MAAINQQTEPAGGWSGAVLKRIGYLLLTAGVLGRAVFENGLLDIPALNEAISSAMGPAGGGMSYPPQTLKQVDNAGSFLETKTY